MDDVYIVMAAASAVMATLPVITRCLYRNTRMLLARQLLLHKNITVQVCEQLFQAIMLLRECHITRITGYGTGCWSYASYVTAFAGNNEHRCWHVCAANTILATKCTRPRHEWLSRYNISTDMSGLLSLSLFVVKH